MRNRFFLRNEKLEFNSLEVIKEFLVNEFEEHSRSAIQLAKSNLNNEELFLMNGFKNMFSSKLVTIISNWLENKFMVIYRADSLQLIRKFADPKKNQFILRKLLMRPPIISGLIPMRWAMSYQKMTLQI